MRRVAVAVLALLSLLGLSAVVADAATTEPVNYTLTGSSTWNAIDFPSSFTSNGQMQHDTTNAGTYTGTFSAGRYTPTCFHYGPFCARAAGTVTFALDGGNINARVQHGSVTNRFTGPSQSSYVFQLRLHVTSGTGAYAQAHGKLSLLYETTRDNLAIDPVTLAPCYVFDVASCPISDTGTLTGTITR